MLYVENLILGAGISGLSFAYFIGDNYEVLEKESEVGGYCKTTYKDEYTWDYAGHFFHFKNIETKSIFKEVFNSSHSISKHKNTKIKYKDRLIDYPFQSNIHQLPKEEFIDCLYELFFKNDNTSDKNFKNMLYSKFGQAITDKFLVPYNEKLYACNLNDLDTTAMGRFFPYANIDDIIRNMKQKAATTYNDQFDYPLQGAIAVINSLKSKLKDSSIHLNEEIISIDIENKVLITKKASYHYRNLISTIPLNSFLKIIGRENSCCLSWNKVLVFNIGFDKASIDDTIHWAYIPNKNINFYRVGFYNNILNQKPLSLYVEIGFNKNEDINVELEFENAIRNLKEHNFIDTHNIVSYESIVMDPAYVHITERSIAEVSAFSECMKKYNIYFVGRYSEWRYCSMEDCVVSAKNLANFLKKH